MGHGDSPAMSSIQFSRTTLLVSIVVFLAAPWLVANVVAPGFDEADAAQTVELMRILLVSTLIFSVSGISMGILQSYNSFLLPAIAPIMFDLGILFGAGFLIKPFGVHGIAYGAVLGAALHFAVQIPGLIRFRRSLEMGIGIKDPILWKVIRLMLPRIAGLGVFSLNFLADEQYRFAPGRRLSKRTQLGLAVDANSRNTDRYGNGNGDFPDIGLSQRTWRRKWQTQCHVRCAAFYFDRHDSIGGGFDFGRTAVDRPVGTRRI